MRYSAIQPAMAPIAVNNSNATIASFATESICCPHIAPRIATTNMARAPSDTAYPRNNALSFQVDASVKVSQVGQADAKKICSSHFSLARAASLSLSSGLNLNHECKSLKNYAASIAATLACAGNSRDSKCAVSAGSISSGTCCPLVV